MVHKQSIALLVVLGLSGLMRATPATAHHSFAMFDMTKSVRLEGTVTRFEWTNPHSWIFLEVVGPGAAIEQWTIELPAAGVLAREGWTKTYLRPGERVVLHVNPLKDGRKGGNLESFVPPSAVPASP
jgi:uncharacterized protein DUF6152